MAHHIAHLVETAEQAANRGDPDADEHAARARAGILDLWQHRSAWPNGWPPGRAATLIRLLDDLPEADDPGWGSQNLLGELHLLHHRLLAALTDLATAKDDDVEQGWLRTFGHHLTADEAAVLTRVAGAPRRLDTLLPGIRAARDERSTRAAAGPGPDGADPRSAGDATIDDAGDTAAEVPLAPVLEIATAYRDTVADFLRRAARIAQVSSDADDHSR